MVQTVIAVYENGALHPKVPLSLQEQEEVEIQILIPDRPLDEEKRVDLSDSNKALDQEMDAYIQMHEELKEQYLGKHVAIFQGKLVDHDNDYGSLYERVLEHYPNQTVWISTVREEAISTIQMRSPRFARN